MPPLIRLARFRARARCCALRALSTRKAAEPREVDITNESSVCKLPENDFDPGSISPICLLDKNA